MITSLLERIIALALLVVASPIIIFACCAITIFNETPVFFLQTRIGKHRNPFIIIKLKTMVDGNITRVGFLLRATGIDELPQLWNIVRGDMHFIGPRPLTQHDINRLAWDTPAHDLRFSVKPGITGLGQLVTVCDPAITLAHDHKAITERSVFQSIKILVLSVAILFLGKARIKKYL